MRVQIVTVQLFLIFWIVLPAMLFGQSTLVNYNNRALLLNHPLTRFGFGIVQQRSQGMHDQVMQYQHKIDSLYEEGLIDQHWDQAKRNLWRTSMRYQTVSLAFYQAFAPDSLQQLRDSVRAVLQQVLSADIREYMNENGLESLIDNSRGLVLFSPEGSDQTRKIQEFINRKYRKNVRFVKYHRSLVK